MLKVFLYLVGLCIRQKQTSKEAEVKQKGEGKRMDTQEEGKTDQKGKCCSTRLKVHWTQKESSLLIPFRDHF